MVTVFTPTYNRAYIIDALYQSLLRQTDKYFEWLVVDDGSTDGTEAYFKDVLSRENPFSVRYIKQENGGKHRAINRAVPLAKGELFFIVDSDDYLTEDAIEKLNIWKQTLPENVEFCAISGARGYSKEEYVGSVYAKADYIDLKSTERKNCGIYGDKAEAWFTDVLRKYPFPEFPGEKFVTEATVWDAMARDGYQIRYFMDIIYICDYLEDGLTKNMDKIWKENPKGVGAWAKVELENYSSGFRKRAKIAYQYYCIERKKKPWHEMAHDIGMSGYEFFAAVIASKIYLDMKK